MGGASLIQLVANRMKGFAEQWRHYTVDVAVKGWAWVRGWGEGRQGLGNCAADTAEKSSGAVDKKDLLSGDWGGG